MSYFSFFPTRHQYPLFLINETKSKQQIVPVSFPDFFRQVSLDHVGVNDSSFYYNTIKILDGERPDQLSYRLYGTAEYYWTFFIVNDSLRLGENLQWPLSYKNLERKVDIDYSGQTIISFKNRNFKGIKNPFSFSIKPKLTGKFQIGEQVVGLISKVRGTVVNIRPEFGQLILKGIITVDLPFFSAGESVFGETSGDSIICDSALLSSEAPFEYYDPVTGRRINNRNFIMTDETLPTNGISSITYREHFRNINDKLKTIRVLKPSSVKKFSNKFKETISRQPVYSIR